MNKQTKNLTITVLSSNSRAYVVSLFFSHVCNWTLPRQAHNKSQQNFSINICLPHVIEWRQKSHFLNRYLSHSPFTIREVSEHVAAFAHRAAGSGRKLSAGAGTLLPRSAQTDTPMAHMSDPELKIKGKWRLIISKHSSQIVKQHLLAALTATMRGLCNKYCCSTRVW